MFFEFSANERVKVVTVKVGFGAFRKVFFVIGHSVMFDLLSSENPRLHGSNEGIVVDGKVIQRWIRETPDIMKLYMNQYWTKPKDNEKPTGYKQIEQSCYW